VKSKEENTILQELKSYAESCIQGEIPSCQKHIWACKRFLKDLERENTQEFPYHWDEKEAHLIVKWFQLLKHQKGILAGQSIALTTWQKFSLCQIYGWRRENDTKRFRKSFIEVARKNAKSQMEAGCILYEMSTQAVKNGEIYECYCAGTKREQSKVIFNECQNMLQNSPLKSKFLIRRDAIVHRKTGSFLKPLCKDDGRRGDGTNPAVLVLDEYHQHETTEFYDLGLGSNTKESLLMIITTAGMDLTFPCYTNEYMYCSSLLNPYVDCENESYFVDICEMDSGDDVGEMRSWQKANPIRASYPEGIEKIEAEYKLACDIPANMTSFLTKCLNVWVQQKENSYMDMAKWKACEVKKIPYDLKKSSVYVGFDMSAKIDLTSVAFIIPVKDMENTVKYVVFSHSFIPNELKLKEHILVDKQPYDAWVRNEYITVTDTEIVDQQMVMDYVLKTCQENEWNIEFLCFDPANSSKLMTDLSNEGYAVEQIFQTYRSLNDTTAAFREQVYCKNVLYLPNPVLNYAMSNTVVRTNGGLIKIDKDKSRKRIDPVDAVLCAFKLALEHEFIEFSLDEWLDSDEW